MHSAGHRVRKLHPLSGPGARVTTVAGSGVRGFRDGAAGEAMFNHPNDVLPFGATGDLLVRKPLARRLNAALT